MTAQVHSFPSHPLGLGYKSPEQGFREAIGGPLHGAMQATQMTDETFWGYIVRANTAPRSSAVLRQWCSGITGLGFLIAALGFWVLPNSDMSAQMAPIKLAASGLMAIAGSMMVWFGAQFNGYEIQVDIAHGEVREAVRNNKGQVRLLSRIPFADIGSVFIERSARGGRDLPLMLRYKDTAQVIQVRRGAEGELNILRDRLAQDILGMSARRKRQQDSINNRPVARLRATQTVMRMSGRG